MLSIKNIVNTIQETFMAQAKARTLAHLRSMDRKWLDERGFSLEALDQGVNAWPWRKPEPSPADMAAISDLNLDVPAANEVDHRDAA